MVMPKNTNKSKTSKEKFRPLQFANYDMHNDMESATDASLCTPYTLICRNSDSSLGSTLEKVEVAPTIEDRVILFFVKNGLNENIAVRLVVSFKQTVYIGL